MPDSDPPSASMVKTPAHQLAYNELKRAIMAGEFAPGETFSIQRIADKYAFGAMPVREALKRLSADGAVEVSPKRAMRIPMLNRQQVIDICRMRLLLEGEAAALAAAGDTATVLKDLKKLDKTMNAHLDNRNGPGFLVANQAFHFKIYGLAGAYMMAPIIEMLWLQIGPLQACFGAETHAHGRGLHAQIIAALELGDRRLARAAMESDIQSGIDALLEFVDP